MFKRGRNIYGVVMSLESACAYTRGIKAIERDWKRNCKYINEMGASEQEFRIS